MNIPIGLTILWDSETLATPLAEARYVQGRMLGKMEALGLSKGRVRQGRQVLRGFG